MIKIRVWDEVANEFINKRDIWCNVDCEGGLSVGRKVGSGFQTKKLIIEQFTGLMDENGKEICEGDIISSYFLGEKIIREVKIDFSDLAALQNSLGSVTILGNIHENPELMIPPPKEDKEDNTSTLMSLEEVEAVLKIIENS